MLRLICHFCLILGLLSWANAAQAGVLADRLAQYPHIITKPPVTKAKQDLTYPEWMQGTWDVTSTLVDLVAPLAPDIVTPGFASNQRLLEQPFHFAVRYIWQQPTSQNSIFPLQAQSLKPQVFPDRVFNGLNIARAYLGEQAVTEIRVNPQLPLQQITKFKDGRELLSVVTANSRETPTPECFITSEIYQQIFQAARTPYLNIVETTTAYKLQKLPNKSIQADQVTAIYLAPQDSNFVKAEGKPVALYHYLLNLVPMPNQQP